MAGKKILVTGIGGNVGQGIVRNLNNAKYNLTIIGSNAGSLSSGNHLCERVYDLPFAYDKGYIEAVVQLCQKEGVDLIIPSTDYESYYLAKNRKRLPSVAASPVETVHTCLNKLETYRYLSQFDIPFAKSCLPSEYKAEFQYSIAKPMEGRGSRGIHLNPKNIRAFSDDEYMIQELHQGREITTAFYVGLDGRMVGQISMERTLVNGATTFCQVTHDCDAEIERIIRQIMEVMEIRGACNIQYILDDNGEIHPFEINCRISGTNSIRANFGFNDTVWTIEEMLFGKAISTPNIQDGGAYRILMDVILPEGTPFNEVNKNTNHYLY